MGLEPRSVCLPSLCSFHYTMDPPSGIYFSPQMQLGFLELEPAHFPLSKM